MSSSEEIEQTRQTILKTEQTWQDTRLPPHAVQAIINKLQENPEIQWSPLDLFEVIGLPRASQLGQEIILHLIDKKIAEITTEEPQRRVRLKTANDSNYTMGL